MSDAPSKTASPAPAGHPAGERERAVDARLLELFRKQRTSPLMEELRKAVRSHVLARETS